MVFSCEDASILLRRHPHVFAKLLTGLEELFDDVVVCLATRDPAKGLASMYQEAMWGMNRAEDWPLYTTRQMRELAVMVDRAADLAAGGVAVRALAYRSDDPAFDSFSALQSLMDLPKVAAPPARMNQRRSAAQVLAVREVLTRLGDGALKLPPRQRMVAKTAITKELARIGAPETRFSAGPAPSLARVMRETDTARNRYARALLDASWDEAHNVDPARFAVRPETFDAEIASAAHAAAEAAMRALSKAADGPRGPGPSHAGVSANHRKLDEAAAAEGYALPGPSSPAAA